MQQSDAASLVVAFGVTPNNPNGQTQITFRPAGTAPNITLTAQVNFGEMFNQGGNSTAVIKVDHDMRKQILDHFKAEVDRLNALKAPIIAMLKDYAVLNGTSQAMYPADKAGFTDQITLSRSPQNNTWIGQAQITSRSTGVSDVFPVMAGVGIVGDKVALQILSQKRVYQFDDIDASAGKLTGAWQMPNYPNGHPAELSVTQAIDAKDRDQFFAASKAAIQKLDSAAVYHAIINDLSDNNQPPNPVSISLGAGADGSITGTAVYPLYGATMTLSGKEVDTPLGPQLQIQYTGGTADAAASPNAAGLINAVQHEVWLLSPAIQSTGAAAGAMRFTGYGLQNRNMPPFTIELIPYTDADKAAVTLALNTGVKFQLHHPIMPPEATDIIELSADPASGGITGHLTTAGHQLNTPPDVTFTGPIADQSGYAQLTMPIMRKIIKSPVYSYDLLVTPTDQGLYLTGYCYNIRMGANRPLGRWDAVEVK
jgi:hypothetical protein